MIGDNADPIILDLDFSRVLAGTATANRAMDDYSKRAEASSARVRKVFDVDNQALGRTAESSRTYFERMTESMERYTGGVERMGRATGNALAGLSHATREAATFAVTLGVATKAIAVHTAAANALEASLNRLRVARIAAAGALEGIGGAAVAASEIAIVAAVEKAGQMTYATAARIQSDAIRARQSGFSYGQVETLDFATRRLGVPPEFFDSGVRAAGGIGALGERLKSLGEIQDPVERVNRAFLELGADAEKYLPYIGDRFAENTERVKDWGLQLDETSRTNIARFKNDIDSLAGAFHSMEDATAAWAESVRLRVVDAFAGIYSGVRDMAVSLGGMLGGAAAAGTPELGVLGRFAGALFPGSLPRTGGFPRDPQNMTADAAVRAFDTYSGAAARIFQQNNLDSQETRLRENISRLQSQLFVHDPTSPAGTFVSGANYPGGYVGRAYDTQQLASDQALLDKITADKKAGEAATELANRLKSLSGSLMGERAKALSEGLGFSDSIREFSQRYGMLEFGSPAQKSAYENALAGLRRQAAGAKFDSDLQASSAAALRNIADAQQLASMNSSIAALNEPNAGRATESARATIARIAQVAPPPGTLSPGETAELAKRELSYRERMIELTSGPGGEMEAARQIYTLRVQSAQSELEKRIAGLELSQREAEILSQMRRQQTESIAGPASGLFHTLLTKPSQFPKQLQSTLHEAMIRPISEGLGQMTGRLLQPLIYGDKGDTGIAGMFHNLFGNVNVENGALDVRVVNIGPGAQGQRTTAEAAAPRFTLRSATFGSGSGPVGGGGMFGLGPSVASMLAPVMMGGLMMGSSGGLSSVSSTIDFGEGPVDMGSTYSGSASPAYGYLGPGRTGGTSQRAASSIMRSIALAGGPSTPAAGRNGLLGLFSGFNAKALGSMFSTASYPKTLSGTSDPFTVAAASHMALGSGEGVAALNAAQKGFGGDLSSVLTSPGAGSLYTSAGMPLAMAGLTGVNRGTWTGIGESTLGGAMTGAGIGTMILPGIGTAIGAAVGAVAGFAAGGIEDLVGDISPRQKAKNYAQSIYHISISNQEADAIVQIAQSKYAGNVNTAVRSPEVRQMLGVYAAGTGQSSKMPISASTPYGGSLVEQGGKLYQQATYLYGNAMTQQSNLPVAGGIAGSTIPSSGGPTYMSLNISGQDTASFMNGTFVTPESTMANYAAAMDAGNGRQNSSAMIQQPGLVVG